MAFNQLNNTIYGLGESGGVPALITIDPSSGAGTLVGITGTPGGGGRGFTDMSFRPSDNLLFTHNLDNCGQNIYTINVTSGMATLVGSTANGCEGGNSLEFDASNTLYLGHYSSGLWTVNQSTGAATFVRALNYPPLLSGGSARPHAMK